MPDFNEPSNHQNSLQNLNSNPSVLYPGHNDSYLAGSSNSHEILFISPDIPDYHKLIDGVYSDIEVVILDLSQNGIFQISEVLARHQNLSAIHIVTHGSDSDLQLGSTDLNSQTLSNYENNLTTWGNALSEEGDILFYGCNLTDTAAGVNLVQHLSEITGADIAASNDLTGSQQQGGDWNFETKIGTIEANLAFADYTIASYDSVFASLSGNISGTQKYGELIAAGPAKNSDNVTVTSDVTLTGDVTIDVVGDFTLNNFTISGDGVGDRDSLTINSTDKVTIGGFIGGSGFKNFTINAPKIEILGTATISTRLIDQSGTFDWLTSASTGDSGSINFKASANAKDFPGIFLFSGIAGLVNASPEIKVNSGAKLLAHVLDGDTTHKAGDITIQGEDIEQRLAGITLLFGYSNKQVDITVDGATIKGANVTLKANAEDYNPFSEAPAWAQKLFIEPATNSLSYVLSKFTIPATVEVRGSDADITVKNSNIDASGKVDITTSANVDSSVKAISMVDDFVNVNKNRFAAAYGRAVGGAEILIDGTTTIDANKDVNIASKTTTTAKVLAQVFGNVTQNLGNAANGNELGFAVAMANTVTTAKAIVNQDVTINSGGNVKVKADGKVNSEGKAQTSIFLDGKAGVGLGANWDETTIEATVNGKITASGSSVEKNLDLANVSSTNDTITIPNHGFKMGDEIVYNNGGGSNIGGLNNGETYTVFVVDENTIKLTKGEGLDLDNSNVTSGVHHSLSPQKGIFFDPATAIDVNTDIITLANHGLTTGQQVVYSSDQNGTDVNELDTGVEHYVIVVNANQIKLAYTIDAAARGTAINFVEDAEGSDKASGTGTSHLLNYNQQVQTKTAFDPTGTGVVNINNDTIAITNHGFATGQIINYSSGTGTAIGGLTSGRGYFAIVVDENTIKLANTIAEAESETAINLLTGAVGTAHQFTFMTSPIQFDPGDDAIVDSGKNTIKITNHGFTTGQTLYYQVDPTISTTESLPFNLSFEPATEVDVATDKITLQSHGLQDGEIVTYEIGYLGESATVVGGLTANATYKVKVVDANTIQLLDPTTQAVKDLTSTGTGSLHNLKVSRTVTAGDTAIRGLRNQEYYHVVVIDANTIQLTEDVLEAVNANPIQLDPSVASVPTDKSQSFKIPQATSGITIAANLDATDKVIVKGSNGSSPKWRDLLANPALLYTSGTSSLFEPGRAKDLLKGKTDVKDSKGDLIQNPIGKMSDNTSISVGVGFGLNLFKHTVTANVGSTAVLKSSADVTISATTKQKLQTLVEAATSKDGAGKAVAVGIGVGIYTNTVQATVANNAQIDAKGKLAVTTDLTYPFLLDFKKDFDFANDPLNAYGNLAVLISDVFLDGSLGFPKRILNTFVTSKNKGGRDVKDGVAQQIKGGDFGFALSGSYSEYNNTSAASIGDNAKINQQTNYRTDNQAVLVSALTDMTLLNAVGIFHLDVAVDNIARGAYKNDATEVINFFGNRAKSGLGVSILVQQLRNTTTAKVGAGAFIHTGSLGEGLDVKAKEDIFWLDFVQSGGDAEKVGFSGSGLGFVQDSTTIAQIGTGVSITGGSVSVKAESDVQRYAILGSIQQTDNVGIGASVGYNEVDRTTKAIIGKDVDDTTQPVGNPVSINVAGNVDLEAKNTGNYWVFSLAGSYSEAAQPGAPAPGDYGVNVSGNVALNYIDDTAQAYINNAGTITTTGNVSLNAINDSFLGTFSGGFAFGGGAAPAQKPPNVSLYGAYSLNDFKNKTQAFIIGAAVTAGDVELKALEDVIVVSGSIGLAGNYVTNPTGSAATVNVAGSVSQNIIKNTTEAFLQNASVNATGNLKLTADDTSQIYAIAGLLGLGITTGTGGNAGTVTFGVSAATNKIENTIRAYIDNSTINATATNTGNVEVTAKVSEAKIFALTLAGSVATSNAPTNSAFGVAGAGSGSGNTVDSDIAAFVSNNSVVNIKNTSKSLSITATDNSYIEANAGGFSLALAQSQSTSVAVSVGVSASVNKITNSTIAYVDKSRVLSTGTVSITADSTATIKALSIAGSVSGTQSTGGLSGAFAGAGAGSGNTINNTIEAKIKNTANVSSTGTITLLAKDSSKITADAGGVAIAVALGSSSSLAGSIGASVATNDIDNKIRAVIEGAGTTVTSTTGGVSVTATSTATIDNFVLGGSVAGAQGSGGAAAGSGASARNEITNTIETAIKNSAIVTANGAIALLAKDTSTITSDAGGGSLAIAAGGNTGVAIAIGVALAENIVNNQVSAYIDNAKASSTSNNITITADSDATITAKSVAVSIAIAAGQNIGAGFSGGGAAATNVILTDTNAYIKDSTIDNVGNLTLTTTSDNTIDADVVAIAVSVGAGSGGGGVAAAIGGSLARNYIGYEANGTKSPSQVRAYIENSSITARGTLSQTATATGTITADVGAGALAVAASSELAVSLVGAGAVAENKVAAEVKAFINGDGTATTGISANSIALKADDTTINTARVGAASVGVSFSGFSAVAASIGVSLARNDIRNEVQAYIQNANNKVEARNGSLTIEAIERSTITSNAVAVSVSVAVSTNVLSASLALSGAGAESTNIINNSVKAFVDKSIIETKGGNANDIKLDAQSTSHISALAGAVGVAGSGGLLAASGSIGVSLARNLIGYDSITDDSGYGNEVLAYIKDSTATSAGDIKVYATNTDTIETVSFAGSVALSFGVGLAIAGAGAESTSKMSSNIYAYLENTQATAGVDLEVKATSDSQVTKAHTVGAAIAAVIGAGGAISVAASNVINKIENDVQAYVKSSTAKTIQATTGDILISADVSRARISNVTAVTASIAVDSSLSGFAFSGGGVGLYNTVNNKVDAYITGPVTAKANTGNVSVLASEDAFLSSDATVITVAVSLISAALGVAIVENKINSTIQAWVDDNSATAWTATTPATALTTIINSVNTTVYADSVANIDKTLTAGVSGATVGVTGNKAEANIKTAVKAFVEGTKLASSGDIEIKSTANDKARTSANGGAFGGLAIGGMVSTVNLGQGNNVDEVVATLGNGTQVTAKALRIQATSIDDLLAESVAAGGGAIAIAGAQSNVTSDLATLANIGNNAQINVNSLTVTSDHEQDVDAAADSFQFALAVGSGAGVSNNITSKANVDIGTSTTINAADNVIINAINRLTKDQFKDADGRSNLRSGSAAFGNLSVLASSTDIGTSSNPFEAVVNVGNGTSITVQGTNQNPGLLRIETVNDVTAFDSVRLETVAGYAMGIGLSKIDATTKAGINLNGATLDNKSGDVYLTARTDSGLRPSANLLAASYFGGVAAADAKTTNNATNQIKVDGATVKGSDIYLYAGKDSFGIPNLLDGSANTEITSISFGPAISIPVLKADINETNQIDITGVAKLQALEDVNLIAEKGLEGDSKRTQTDGLILNLSLIPYGFDVPDGSNDNRTNKVNIGNQAIVEAGINNKSVVQIKPLTLGGVQQLNPEKLGTELSATEKEALSLSPDIKYEYGKLNLDEVGFSISTGTVIQVATGANKGGTVGNYYKYKPVNNTADTIILENENFSNTSRWESLGSTLTAEQQQSLSIYNSDATLGLKNTLRDKFYVIKPVDLAAPKFSYVNIGNLLIEQRQQVLGWIANHAGNAEAIARYQVQLEDINQTLKDLGLFETITNPTTGQTATLIKKELDALFLELPNIYAAPGSIFIEDNQSTSTTFTSLLGNRLIARGGAEINILNQSPFTLKVNDTIIRDNKRVTVKNGAYTVLEPGNVYFNNGLVSGATSNTGDKKISIVQDAFAKSQYSLGSLQLPSIDQDMFIVGDVINESGDLLIDNKEGSINVSGEIRAENVTIRAARDFNLNVEDWFHTNQDPRQYINYDILRSQVFNTAGTKTTKTFDNTTDVTGLEAAINQKKSSILAQGAISVTARYLNVNGLIQSGVNTVTLDIASTFNPGNITRSFVDDDGNVVSGISFGVDKVPVDGYFDAQNQAIVVEDIIPQGGKITLAGKIFSTGNGQLKVANGYANVNINNDSNYKLILNRIDNTTNRQGKITIIDTESLNKVEYAVDGTGVQEIRSQGSLVPASDGQISTINYVQTGTTPYSSLSDDIKYQPQTGLKYVWTEGQEKTEVVQTKYEKNTFNLFGDNDFADLLSRDESYSWQTVEFRDEQPLLESESVLPDGTNNPPSYSTGKAYTIEYEQRNDETVDLIKNTSLVKYNGVVYRYIGDNADLKLATQTYTTDTTHWTATTIDAATFVQDPAQNKFNSDYVNSSLTVETWTTGGGWLRKKTYHTLTTEVTGVKDFYTHTLKADYAIDIDFLSGSSTPQISISSNADIFLQGNIDTPNSGKIDLTTSNGSVQTTNTNAIFGAISNINVDGDFKAIVSGSQTPLNVTADGDIEITVVSQDNQSSSLVVGNITSTNGNVIINAPNGIVAQNANSHIKGNQVELRAEDGVIGTTNLAINIDSNTEGNGGFAAKANGSINIVEKVGDLKLAKATSWDGDAAVESANGDVRLETVNGSILDGINELFTVGDQLDGGVNSSVQALINNGTVSADALKYPISPGLYSALYPNADFLGLAQNTSVIETPNIIGNKVTLIAKANANEVGQIGRISDTVSINLSQGYAGLTTAEKQILSTATAEDILGVVYETYQYIGSNTTGADVSQGNFSDTSKWQKLTPNFTTQSDRLTAQSVSIAQNQIVLVQYSAEEYGLYKYLGQSTTLDLASQDYDTVSRWQKVTVNHRTNDNGTSLTVIPNVTTVNDGDLLYRYIGTSASLNLTNVDYAKDSNWKDITFTQDPTQNRYESTYGNSTTRVDVVPDTTLVKAGNTIYRYIGTQSASLNLRTENYSNTAKWQVNTIWEIADNFVQNTSQNRYESTFRNQNKTLLNGQLVENRFVVSRLALQLQDDVDLEAANAVTIEADNGVTAQTTGSLQINHVRAGDNVRLVAEGAITDLNTDPTAAITSLGDLTLRSEDASITGVNNNALRIQVAPSGQLSARAQGSINLQQVSADTTVDGQFQAISDLYVARTNAGGDVKIAVAEGDMTVGKVVAGNSVNLTAANNIRDAFDDRNATVVNISTATGDVDLNAGGDIGTTDNFLDVEIPTGQFSASAGNDIFLRSVASLNVADIISNSGDVNLDVDGDVKIDPITATSGIVTINADGSIIDALDDDNSEINAISIKLTAGGAIGSAANSLDIDSSNATLGTVAATANGGVYLIETNGNLRVDLIKSQTTDVTLVAKNGSILDANEDAVNIEGVNINLTATTGSIGEVNNDLEIDSAKPTAGKLKATATNNIYIKEISGGLNINSVDAAQGDVRLTVKETAATGEDLLLDGTAQVTAANASVTLRAGDNITADANSLISAKQNITILGDYANADPVGTTINLNGRIVATNVLIQGELNADIITLHLQELVGNTSVLGGGSNDQIIVDRLPSLDKTRRGQSNRNNLTLDGQTGGDIYTVNITGTVTDYITNVFDTGTDAGQDKLTIYGTNVADNFLLRAAEDRVNGVAFVAALHGDPIVDVERVNYNLKLEKLIVNAQDGDDTITLDDNWAETTVTGGIGNDKFQVGQIFQSLRDTAAGVAPKDVFETVQTTRGYLSSGVSFITTLDGDTGNDTFTVYRNKAVLNLNGGDDDDLFVIRAFAEEGSSDNNVTAGQGTDNIQYVVNAPVNVNGGDGNDTLKIIGTEFADKFVVTANAISGAGRTVNYNNIETVIIDGAEGDDEFFVLSTGANVVTKLFGGLGNDKFSLGGDAKAVVGTNGQIAAQEGSHKVDAIQGQLFIDGFAGEGSTSIGEPVMLPGETNQLASTGDVIAYSAVNNTMTVATADLLTVVSTLNELIGKTLEISKGNGLRRFWQIISATDSNGQAILTLKNPTLPNPSWGTPDSNSEYAIRNLSVNFFVNENETLDVVTVFNDGSTANTPGTLTATTLTGLGMSVAGVTYNNFEVVEVLLGTGNDQFTVQNTADGAIAAIHGGGGDDTITVRDRGNVDSRGKDAPLAIFGDTTQDGSRYTDTPTQINPGFAYSFNTPGNDTINASVSLKSVSIYGGAGNDSITGSQAGDQIAGGSGNDNINGQAGADHIYGDSGFNLDTVTRELKVQTVDTSLNPSRDSLTVGNDTINGSSGDNIIFGDHGIITQTIGTSRILTTGNVTQVETANAAVGGNDAISAGGGQDIILGGFGSDSINASDGNNIVIGDNGKVAIAQRIETTDSNLGSNDTITTGSGEDIVLGGFASDNITTGAGNDIALGDNGYISYVETDNNPDDIDRIKTTNAKDGGSDTINSGANNDFVFGGVGNDQINAGDDNDLIFGDNGVVEGDVNANLLPLSTLTKPFTFTSIDTANTDAGGNQLGGNDTINAGAGKDIAIAGQGNDNIYGEAGDDDIVGGHNVAGGNDANDTLDGGTGNDVIAGDNASILRRGNALSPRIRTLNGQVIYDSNGNAQVTANSQLNPTGVEERSITLFNHSDTPAANTFGNDKIAGGAQDDVIFGQLGDDTIQGDGSVSINVTPTTASVEDFAGAGTDGDDYIEGNGGGDLILGNLGQDDIIGGSSNLFSLTASTQRPDGADTIFGGAGTDVARNDLGDASVNGHVRDADYILGDNGNIFRLIRSNGQFLSFNYDFYGSLKVIPRAIQLLDYTQGGAASDRGTGDVLHGESGDDVIHGMTGNDVIFGEGQDDDIYGGVGSDRIYGGAGEDGILGDDGKIFTSRNGLTEALYGVNTINAQVNLSISGPFTGAWVYITGRLNKTVDLAAIESGSSDIIYGGLGDDFLHGGAGDDGISGAEAQAAFYNSNPVTNTNTLGYDSVTRKLAAYDANNPMKKITSFFLNFDAVDGSGIKINDGKDNIFGDSGNDWLVSGTQNDRLFGGLGDDVLNADDNLDTAGGLNNQPDVTEFADRDFAFGGGGLDVLIGNTGGDRLFDWNGEYNSYWVPFSPFGNPTVVRSPSPQIQQFLLNLGKSSGADQTLTEPNGELGLTTSGENGSPRDPQGNNSNASRDTQGAPEDDRATSLPLTGN